MAWVSHFIRPLNLKAGHASPQCFETFLISNNLKIGPHNSVTILMKIGFVVSWGAGIPKWAPCD